MPKRRKKPEPVYKCINPMLADADRSQLKDKRYLKQYVLQEKFDGTRGILYKRGNSIKGIIARSCTSDFLDNFPEIVAEAQLLPVRSCTLDGEITFFNRIGNPFYLTAKATQSARKGYTARYMVFDVLDVDGVSMQDKPLWQRLKVLKQIIPSSLKHIKVVKTYETPSQYERIYKKIVKRKGEGVMLKKKTSPYVAGSREHWKKVKKEQTEDCVVIGITEGTGRRKSTNRLGNPRPRFGALMLGQYHKGQLVYVGNVGSGLSDETVHYLYGMVMRMRPARPQASMPPALKYVHPRIVVEVKCLERTPDGKLRLPVFLRIRDDKSPFDCTF